ncbi:MAG TPA: hypothetical protein DIT03_00615 [Candidatus Accumulibacter sp.]|nr:hypothetical protein [Accumulibacter sp.]
MYRLIVESLLGLRLASGKLHLAPRLPADWPAFVKHHRHHETTYHITVSRTPAGSTGTSVGTRVLVDGVERDDQAIPLLDDRREHAVEVHVPAEA